MYCFDKGGYKALYIKGKKNNETRNSPGILRDNSYVRMWRKLCHSLNAKGRLAY